MFKQNKKIKYLFLSLIISVVSCGSSGDGDEKIQETAKDNIKQPTISCPESVSVTVDAFTNEIAVTYTTPVGKDNLKGAVTTQIAGFSSGSLFPLGTTTNTFSVKDAAGNTINCSFDVTIVREAASKDTPFLVGKNPIPTNKTWKPITDLSDEFEGAEIDLNKWYTEPSAHPHLIWPGRPPALFQAENIKTKDGKMVIEAGKLSEPVTISPYGKPLTYTYYGGILRSKITTTVGNYYECRMKMNKTEMGGGFWLMGFNNECDKKHEIDITESVGHLTDLTHEWAKAAKWDEIYHSNSIRREDKCNSKQDKDEKKVNTPTKNHERYYVYGFWWKSTTELLFYLDGEYQYTLNPPVPFDQQMYVQFSIESYDWNPIPDVGSKVETASLEDRTTYVDYIRSFKLADK